ncbi:MAG: methionyl-tRNA formyltransferase [Actinomycetota bacterium]|nr:methionyl-tRNA formyltransferase [Actinomycetota bacterium]
MRTIFLGNDSWSVPTLEALASAEPVGVELVITNPPRPAGRGSRPTPTPVHDAARRLDVEVMEVAGVREGEGRAAIERIEPDVVVVVAYGEILTPDVLAVPRLGTVNLHFSLLPRWRGAAPVQRAILEGDETTGVSVMLLDAGLDTGPVLASAETAIRSDDDAGSLGDRLASDGAGLVVDTLLALDAGTAIPVAQTDDGVTIAGKLTSDERIIDWSNRSDAIVRRVRAFAPSPGATTTFRGALLKIVRASSWQAGDASSPGEIGAVHVEPGGVPLVTASGGEVALLEVVPAGRARMSGADWARGARIEPGERCR